MYYVYVLRSDRDEKFYIGSTSDLRKRISTHSAGGVPSTRQRRPLKLVFYEAYLAKIDAIRREQYFKTSPGKKTLGLMLRDSVKVLTKH
mgnify:CR=1 FL=1